MAEGGYEKPELVKVVTKRKSDITSYDFYKRLGVGRGAKKAEIEGAFKELIKDVHPDRSASKQEKRLKDWLARQVTESSNILKNPNDRHTYNAWLTKEDERVEAVRQQKQNKDAEQLFWKEHDIKEKERARVRKEKREEEERLDSEEKKRRELVRRIEVETIKAKARRLGLEYSTLVNTEVGQRKYAQSRQMVVEALEKSRPMVVRIFPWADTNESVIADQVIGSFAKTNPYFLHGKGCQVPRFRDSLSASRNCCLN